MVLTEIPYQSVDCLTWFHFSHTFHIVICTQTRNFTVFTHILTFWKEVVDFARPFHLWYSPLKTSINWYTISYIMTTIYLLTHFNNIYTCFTLNTCFYYTISNYMVKIVINLHILHIGDYTINILFRWKHSYMFK
jgi:hypothetical protein